MRARGSIGDAAPFQQQALDDNRNGRLTAGQRRMWRRESRSFRGWELFWAALLVFLGIAASLPRHPTSHVGTGEPIPDSVRPFFVVGCLVLGAFLAWRAFTGGDAVTEDTRRGEVRSIEGAVLKRVIHLRVAAGSGDRVVPVYYVDVAGETFQVAWKSGWDTVPETGYVRVFYLPRSRRVVNFERLPDPPVPEVTLETVSGVGPRALKAAFGRDRRRKAETYVELASEMRKFEEQARQAAIPPPADQRDARPLAEAIVGSWSNGRLEFNFLTDGTMTMGSPRGGRRRSGRWSIGADGRLHATETGPRSRGEWVTEAWVRGDEMTIVGEGMGLTFRRVSC
jgi:hypothetical protein